MNGKIIEELIKFELPFKISLNMKKLNIDFPKHLNIAKYTTSFDEIEQILIKYLLTNIKSLKSFKNPEQNNDSQNNIISKKTRKIKMKHKIKINKEKNRIALYMVGGPGSGKTTIKHKLLKQLKLKYNTFIDFDPDEIFTLFFENDRTYRNYTFEFNRTLFKILYNEGYNIIWDTSGINLYWTKDNLIRALNNANYTLNICIVKNTMEIAKVRIAHRQAINDRVVFKDYIEKTYKDIDKLINVYKNMDCNNAKNIFIFDNSLKRYKLIFHSTCDGRSKKQIKYTNNI